MLTGTDHIRDHLPRDAWYLYRTAPGAVSWRGDLNWDTRSAPAQPPASQVRGDSVALSAAPESDDDAVEGEHGRLADRVAAAADHVLAATVPGTAAGAWRDAELPSATFQADAHDWWWTTTVNLPQDPQDPQDPLDPQDPQESPGQRAYRLELRGVATVSEVFWDGRRVAASVSGLDDIVADLTARPGEHELAIVCRALELVPVPRKPRPRWRSTLVSDSSLRWRRTPLIGRIPWAGTAVVVGPWGESSLRAVPHHGVSVTAVRTELSETDGGPATVHVDLTADRATTLTVRCAGAEHTATLAAGQHRVALEVRGPALWWPATHGTPTLHDLEVQAGGQLVERRRVGFRQIRARTDHGGFTLEVNGTRVFVRGAVWTPVDALTLGDDPAEIDRTVRAMRAAGANLLRISGTHAWEAEAFYRACDRHGLLVWHDAMLATLDPPSEPSWLALVEDELRTWLPRLGAHPCVAVFSGGNEVLQQPVLWGRDLSQLPIPVIDDLIPRLTAELAPQVVHVSSTPCGGEPPIRPDRGISHWFGVGAYRRPLSDVRTCGVRFAAEALAFGVPPAPSEITRFFGTGTADSDDSVAGDWRSAAARDPGAAWDFEDTSVHYARRWIEPGMEADTGAAGAESSTSPVRLSDTGNSDGAWSALSRDTQLHAERAAVAQAVEHTLTDLRRGDSGCDGVIVLASRDLTPGAGWGLLDSTGRPKATWYAMRRACAETAVTLIDDGLSGLHVHVHHDQPVVLTGRLYVRTWTVHQNPGPQAELSVELTGPGELVYPVEKLLGGFLDLDHAWGFGDRQWEALEVELVPDDSSKAQPQVVESLRAVRLLGGGHRHALADLREGQGLERRTVDAAHTDGVHDSIGPTTVELTAGRAAAAVAVDPGPGLVPDDDFMDMPPGGRRILTVRPVQHWPASAYFSRRDGND